MQIVTLMVTETTECNAHNEQDVNADFPCVNLYITLYRLGLGLRSGNIIIAINGHVIT